MNQSQRNLTGKDLGACVKAYESSLERYWMSTEPLPKEQVAWITAWEQAKIHFVGEIK